LGLLTFTLSVQFDPEKIAEDVKKRGGFIPGIRPGKSTSRYLKGRGFSPNFLGSSFLGPDCGNAFYVGECFKCAWIVHWRNGFTDRGFDSSGYLETIGFLKGCKRLWQLSVIFPVI